ncbi:MAG: STAS domain-containing protein [Planctomycetota bacterium]|jgi:anti-anti-sigma factor
MKIVEQKQSAVVVLKPEGSLDSADSPELEAAVLRTIANGETRVVIDLSQVSYITSRGLRVFLLGAKKMATAGGRLAVCSLQEFARKVFDAVGFQEVVPVFDTAAQAVESLSGDAPC